MAKRVLPGAAAAIVLLLVLALGAAWAQESAGQEGTLPGRLQPLLVTIEQSVPLSVTLEVPVSVTETHTLTVPAVVDLLLQVRIADTTTTTVQVARPTGAALVAVSELAEDTQVDNHQIPYQLESVEGIEVIQWRTRGDARGNFQLAGELRNADPEQEATSVSLFVTLYDADGNLLDVLTGSTKLATVAPEGTSPFTVHSDQPLDGVGRYLVQVVAEFVPSVPPTPVPTRLAPAPEPTEPTPVGPEPTATPEQRVVELVDWDWYRSEDGETIYVEGTVGNLSDMTICDVELEIQLLDADKKLLGTDYGFTDSPCIEPGEQDSFLIWTDALEGTEWIRITSYYWEEE